MKNAFLEVKGILEISVIDDDVFGQGVFIGGNSEGLRSMAQLCLWLSELDQNAALELSNESREHIHLRPSVQITSQSVPVEICRLDSKQESNV